MTRRVSKPWGHEEIWVETEFYLGKLLFINAGARLSLQHHVAKAGPIRVRSGRMLLELDDSEGVLQRREMGPGDTARVLPGRRHRFSGITDCEVLEVSTPHPLDVVRHSDDYGREGTSAP